MSAATKRKPPAPSPLSAAAMLALFDISRAPTPKAYVSRECANRLLADGLIEEYKKDPQLTTGHPESAAPVAAHHAGWPRCRASGGEPLRDAMANHDGTPGSPMAHCTGEQMSAFRCGEIWVSPRWVRWSVEGVCEWDCGAAYATLGQISCKRGSYRRCIEVPAEATKDWLCVWSAEQHLQRLAAMRLAQQLDQLHDRVCRGMVTP